MHGKMWEMDSNKRVMGWWMLLVLSSHFVCYTHANDSCPGLPDCFCNKDKTSVNCDGKHFTDIPSTIPATVEKLYLRYNSITRVREGAFESLPRLEKLWLNNNQIISIEPFAFRNLTNLNYLDLRNNKLANISTNTFAGMPGLKTLWLVTNQIKDIKDGAFNGTVSLKSLYLQSNSLAFVPPLGNLPYLEKLILEGNVIKNATFPDTFSQCPRLSYLILSNNKITSLDDVTFASLRNNSMSSLYIARNGISKATPGVFSPFTEIKSLKLGSNPLKGPALKAALQGLHGKDMVSLDLSDLDLNGGLLNDTFALLKNTSLTTLNLQRNAIHTLTDNVFSGLNSVLHLDLSSCSVVETHDNAFAGLEKITILNLNYNKLTEVPQNLPPSLQKLYLDDNEIVVIQNNAFANLYRLVELRIQYNKILTLQTDSFAGLFNLNILSLYDNNINTLPGKLFYPLVRLTQLSLAKNNLRSIQITPNRFSSQGALVYLNLANNECSYLQPDFFKGLASLRYLRLENNHLGAMMSQDYGGALFKGLVHLKELYIMGNRIATFSGPTFQSLGSLTLLNASANRITGWGEDLFASTQKLQVIDLANNLIANLNSDNLKDLPPTMKMMNLSGNPFMCDCDLRWFRDWVNQTSISLANNASYVCNGNDAWKNRPLMSFDRKKIDCTHLTWWIVIGACSLVAVVMLISGIIAYRKRWWIQLAIYKRISKSQKKARTVRAADGHGDYGAIPGEDKKEADDVFDGYISCAEEDNDWVLRNLLPGVDRGRLGDGFNGKYSLYFEPRDSVPGRSMAGNIFENLSHSRKVIVVLTKNYLNPMNRFELDLATDLMYKRQIEGIVIVYNNTGLPQDNIPRHLMHTMRRNHLLEWSEDEHAQELAKGKLNDFLAKQADAVDQGAE